MFHTRLPMPHRRRTRSAAALLLSTLLAACGGGGDPGSTAQGSQGCSLEEQKSWLGSYMDDWYFWYSVSPRPAASAYATVDSYFNALLYGGNAAGVPADRWSNVQSTESFNRFFGAGATLGYGLSVAGLEASANPGRPLYVRYVDPGSPAEAAGLQRGDEVISLNGVAAATLAARSDYTALSTSQAGTALDVQWRRAAAVRTTRLVAATYTLAPVNSTTLLQPQGGRIGYLHVKDMVSQALAPLDAAFTQFRSAGVRDLVLDLRYNGGGLVSTGATLSSYVSGVASAGQVYARLLMNDKHSASNITHSFSSPTAALSLSRVFVLAGQRTCSASEQVVNGLRGAGVQVVLIGDTTCGKPVGFLPVDSCGSTYSVVNFESVNQRGEGRYYSGFAPTCRVSEDFTAAQGGSTDPLLAAAISYAASGSCGVADGPQGARALSAGERRAPPFEGDDRQGLLGR